MKKLLEGYSAIVPIILILVYALGYINLKVFYLEFGIDIEYYITLTDITFYTINILVVYFGVIFSTNFFLTHISTYAAKFYIEYKSAKIFKNKNRSEVLKLRFLDIKSFNLSLVIFFILYLTLFITFSVVVNHIIYLFTVVLPILYFKFYSLMPSKSKSQKNVERGYLRDRDYFFVMIIFILVIFNVYQGFKNASQIKENIYYFRKPKNIEFTSNTVRFSTGGNMKFIGESTEYIFIYNSTSNKSMIFNKQNISDYNIIDPDFVSNKNVKYYINFDSLFNH